MRRLPLLLLVVVVVSCGGGTTTEVGADFAERADAACEQADLTALGTLTQEGGDLAANLREGKKRGDELATTIARLEAPRELRVDRASYVVVISRLAALSGEAAEAAEADDQRHLDEVAEIQGPLLQRARGLAQRLGLTECTPSS